MALRRWVLLGSTVLVAVLFFWGVVSVAAVTRRLAAQLSEAAELAELTPQPQATVVFDRRGRPAFSYFVEQRIDVPLDRIAPVMIDAIIAVEDRRFYRHHGLDPIRIVGAAIRNLEAGRVTEGGSTITQQLVRTAQLSPRRTFERKIREAMIASRLEQRYTKNQILEAYLNTVYFGEGYHGVEAASRGYFHKPASELEAHEAALLAALVKAPSLDAPCVSPARARNRRDLVLRLMRDQQRITEAAFRAATSEPVPASSHEQNTLGAMLIAGNEHGLYFQEELRRQLVAQFGNDRVLRGGLRVYSTYDPELQKAAEEAVATRIAQITKRRKSAADLQGALVAVDVATGDVLALVGGRDFHESSFNRATQAHRQAGSAFKPILFAAALEHGYAPGTLLTELDVPIGSHEGDWLPSGEHEASEYTLRRALKVSSNRAAAQLMQQVGTTVTAYYARRLGIQSSLPIVPSLALGTGEVTLLELTAAYTAFANRGATSTPRLFTRVEDGQGAAIFYNEERHSPAISEATAYMMSSMLADVISGGTGSGVRAAGFRLPAAGKTGTTDDYADAWFIGYTPRIVTGVWFGFDRPATIMPDGFASAVAVPAWARFMKRATDGDTPVWYDTPPGIERVAICRLSGARATEMCKYHYVPTEISIGAAGVMNAAFPRVLPSGVESFVYEDIFPLGTIPPEFCDIDRRW